MYIYSVYCIPGIFSLYAYRRTFSIHFFFLFASSVASLIDERKGKRKRRADLLCAVGFSVDTFVSLLWQKKETKILVQRDTS